MLRTDGFYTGKLAKWLKAQGTGHKAHIQNDLKNLAP